VTTLRSGIFSFTNPSVEVVKFSDFGPVEGYISETAQVYTASGTIND